MSWRDFERRVERQLPELLGQLARRRFEVVASHQLAGDIEVDLIVQDAENLELPPFLVEAKHTATSAHVAHAISQLQRSLEEWRAPATALLVVPYMGDVGRRLCQDAGVSWLDLSGNADVVAPGLRILVTGEPNRFKRRGRPKNIFSPKAARLPRLMLGDPRRRFSRRELSIETRLSEGYVSRLAKELLSTELLEEDANGRLFVRHPSRLLDAWAEAYDFSDHEVHKGHVAVRGGGVELADLVYEELDEFGYEPVLTGLAAAWCYDQFAMFRNATLYVRSYPNRRHLSEIGFREESRGANVWLVVPNDPDVMNNPATPRRRRCAKPVQTYLDLSSQPERAAEAAHHLRAKHLGWPDG